ncbi:class I SAM-dependent methyltransferase [Anabaena subtropica]|uniref:Class I SAM-dependent methyltransferase n=1 Tax=Anabaena subtropica FACHB-260 TaxID=2692884 RepID=A0ABR8CQI2_9NOST|nr:class I SAM-dependent methyltransferase [Anabaena subtropica]MBD2344442.1 class I SAM-dependent methyltransferase [Anabaena subtropica FACHB-260]
MNNQTNNSELDRLIPPEIKNDEFYAAIQRIAREEDIKTVLEIGSSSGEGSTEAFVTGLKDNPNKPILFCMEVSKVRFTELKNNYKNQDFVKVYNVSSVPLDCFADEQEVIDFYYTTDNKLKNYPLEMVIDWLKQDIEYVNKSGLSENGIKKIKIENNIELFDLVLIDGSEFTGNSELDEVYGAKYIFLDDINTFKNYNNFKRLLEDDNYALIGWNDNVRNGYAIFKQKSVPPISYSTIHHAVVSLKGFMIDGQEEYLFNKVKSLPEDAVIVEIGSFKGRSTVAMGYACIGTNRKIYAIDTWDGNDSDFTERQFFDIWQHNIKANGLEEYVIPLKGYSYQVLKKWHQLTNNKAIDFIFIDGSHQYLDVLKDFEMSFPLVKESGWMAFHDVIETWPGSERAWHKTAKYFLDNHEYCSSIACGRKTLTGANNSLSTIPIHFFTIVLNGQPFIRYHIDIFKQLPFKWHWHIIEGVADLKHDTSWSVQLGGHISDEVHRNGRSCDGTTEYIDELVQLYPENITVYRQPEGVFWDGKREMVNAPLANIQEECLLWQVDVDELWTLEQICTAREMFISNPDKTAAFYWCWYFVGEKLIISTRNCYAHNPQQEWLRTWRFKPGYIWAAHEPPVLVEPLADNEYKNLAAVNPFLHPETEAYNLVFQHFAYVTPEQLSFKEKYYGYKNAVERWSNLQENSKFPILLREYFPWVYDETQVDTVNNSGIVPIAQRDENDKSWRFLQPEEVQQKINQISKPSPIILIDGIFFQLYQTGIARVWKSLLEEWSNKEFAKHIIFIDRAGTAPKVSGIKYLNLPRYNYKDSNRERELLQQVCDQEGVDLFISSYYTTPITTPSVFMAYDMIPEVMKWDMSNPMWQDKHQAIEHASAYIAISKNTAFDLTKCFNQISLESVILAYCGVSSTFVPSTLDDISIFKTKYGITKPYFLLPGVGSGYKNSILFFQAFSQLVSSYGFDIVVTGGGGGLDAQFRNYTFGSMVHTLQLSDEELAIAYSGAVAVVYPSKYEGFGMPVIEAMACGCPVITCPNASIPEVAGEAAIYINDDDIDGLANALCEVQKPVIRQSLITAGLAQAQKFSWSTMAEIVSSTLINTTLLSLNLREINLIIFPDWQESEDLIGLELMQIIKTLATHPDSHKTTLLIDTTNFVTEDAELLLSSVTMNLLMEEDLDITNGIEISLVANLSEIQWKTLLPRIHGRITLEHENQEARIQVKAENLTSYELASFSQVREEEFFFT